MKQRNTGLHVGKYRKNRTFSSRLTETILPSALIFCALAGLLTTVTGLTAILLAVSPFHLHDSHVLRWAFPCPSVKDQQC